MEFAFGLSYGERALLFPLGPPTSEGRAWEKRPRDQQRAAMLWVLNRLFFLSFCDLPLGDRNPESRRTLLLDTCRKRTSHLEESGWSMHDIMDWLIEINESKCWTQSPCDF
ncbi:MAG: hypothetical protein EOP06_28315 [Proteobacteria bacterium]|nr:MAG: hypothetical protein EOP06_28315 [Pseudomonadota bacterium]